MNKIFNIITVNQEIKYVIDNWGLFKMTIVWNELNHTKSEMIKTWITVLHIFIFNREDILHLKILLIKINRNFTILTLFFLPGLLGIFILVLYNWEYISIQS